MPGELQNWGVLITRPEGRGAGLARLVEQAGGQAVLLPTLRIRPLPPPPDNPLARLGPEDWLIAISPAAVEHGRALLAGLGSGVRCAAVGPGTARAMRDAGLADVLAPATGGSEALLQSLPEETVAGRRVVILKGRGGRELLADVLGRRGARLVPVDVYRRECPDAAPASALRALDARAVDAISVTSAESLKNLLTLAGPPRTGYVQATPLVVASPRLLSAARAMGFSGAMISAGAMDTEMFEGLVALREAATSPPAG